MTDKEFTQEEARKMFNILREREHGFVPPVDESGPEGMEEKDLKEKKEALQKLFTQALANYGVLLFNIKALKVEEDKQFAQINNLKAELEVLNKG